MTAGLLRSPWSPDLRPDPKPRPSMPDPKPGRDWWRGHHHIIQFEEPIATVIGRIAHKQHALPAKAAGFGKAFVDQEATKPLTILGLDAPQWGQAAGCLRPPLRQANSGSQRPGQVSSSSRSVRHRAATVGTPSRKR